MTTYGTGGDMESDKTLAVELRNALRKHYQEAGGGWQAIQGMLALAERLVDQETAEATPDDWRVVGGNRIAVIEGGQVIRIAEFYPMFVHNLPADANAALAVNAVNTLRRTQKPVVDRDPRPGEIGPPLIDETKRQRQSTEVQERAGRHKSPRVKRAR